jgi:hypothetical protein
MAVLPNLQSELDRKMPLRSCCSLRQVMAGNNNMAIFRKNSKDYHWRGFTSVTRGNLDHCLKLYKQGKRMKLVGNNKPDVPVQQIVIDVENLTPNSGVTDPAEESSDPMVARKEISPKKKLR